MAPGDGRTELVTRRSRIELPVFVPDATRAVVRGVSPPQLRESGVEALLVSTAHVAVHPGASVVKQGGGVHRFMSWDGPVISDSGGFQAYSLIAGGQGLASVSERGLRYRFSPKQRHRELTPSSCVTTQLSIGADLIYTLDLCADPRASREEHERSVDLTVRWARIGRRQLDESTAGGDDAPLLFAAVQGGPFEDLRRRCVEELTEIGVDGFGFGGYPIVDGALVESVAMVGEMVAGAPLHGLGIGTPDKVTAAWEAGYSIFDCVLPTRNGRRGVLYLDVDAATTPGARRTATANLLDERWIREQGPVDPTCRCLVCSTYSASYLAHLYRVEDALAGTLGSMHNLSFYRQVIDVLRGRAAT